MKPGNILLDEGGNAYLSDFGLIKRSTVDTGLTRPVSSWARSSTAHPNRSAATRSTAGPTCTRSACVLYESIAGRPPFQRDTEVATLYAHLEQDPPRLASDGSGPVARARPRRREGDGQASLGSLSRRRASSPEPRVTRSASRAASARLGSPVTSPADPPGGGRRRGGARGGRTGAGAVLGRRRDSPSGPAATGSLTNVVQRIDPETGEVMQSIGGIIQKAENHARERVRGGGGRAVGRRTSRTCSTWIPSPGRCARTCPSNLRSSHRSSRSGSYGSRPTTPSSASIPPPTSCCGRSVWSRWAGSPSLPTSLRGRARSGSCRTRCPVSRSIRYERIVRRARPRPGSTGIAVADGTVWIDRRLTGS